MSRRTLVIEELEGYVRITNGQGVEAHSTTLEGALNNFSHRYGLNWTGDEQIRSGFDAAQTLDTLLGQKKPGGGQIHEGVQAG